MTTNWISFKDLLSDIVDNRGKTCPTSDKGIALIGTNCIGNENLFPKYEKIRFVSEETYLNWFRGHPKPGDIIFVTKGTPGRVCMVPDPVDFCIAQDMVAIRADPEKIYPKYLFAILRSKNVQRDIENMHVGTLIPHFKKGDFDKLKLLVPDEQKQKFIGDFYYQLSYKIELNRRMNETLEAMAQAIFTSWFVDFDPVRAKAEGRQPEGMDAETAALFPDEFEVVDGREVPKGWRVHGLDKIAKFLNGLALQKYPPEGNDYLPVIKIAQLRKGNTEGADKASPHVDPAYIIDDGDVLFSWSGSLMVILWAGGRGALNQHLFKVTSDRYPKWFYYLWIKHHLPEFQSIASGKTTTMGHIQRNHLSDAKVFVPPSDQLVVMDRIISQVISMIITNNVQSRTLAEIRDTLLPKLISGEINFDYDKFGTK